MDKKDDLYPLTGMIELDEVFFEIATSEYERQRLKRGKGSQRQADVGVIVESTSLGAINTGIETKPCRYFKMKVLDSEKFESVKTLFQDKVSPDIVVFTYEGNNYQDIHKYVDMHITEKSSKLTTK